MVADTYSTDGVGSLLMVTGNDNNTWGSNANTSVFQILLDAVTNSLSSAVTGGTLDLSGTPPPAAPSQSRYYGLIFTGTLLSNQIVQVPNLSKWWVVKNATAGAFTLKFKTPSGSASTAIPQNSGWQLLYCDAANNIVVWPFNTVQIQMPDGSLTAPPFSYLNETNSGWYRFGTQDLRLVINGAAVLQVTGAGAGTPSIVNILSPNVLQVQGAQYIPAGTEIEGAWVDLPTGYLWCDGTSYLRSAQTALFAALSKAITGNTHSNTTFDNISIDLRGRGLEGAVVEGTGIPSGTTIVAGSIGASSLTLSAAATSTTTTLAVTIIPFGVADTTHFNVPDRRGRLSACRDDINGTAASRITVAGSGVNGKSLIGAGGAETVALIVANIPSHTHTVTGVSTGFAGGSHSHTAQSGTQNFVTATGASFSTQNGTSGVFVNFGLAGSTDTTSISHQHTINVTSDATGSGTSHQNMPPFGICNRAIKT